MPPHDTELRIPLTVNTNITDAYENAYDPLYRPATTVTQDEYVFTTNTWPTNSVTINTDGLHLDTDYIGQKVRIALDRVLDRYFRTLYKVIEEHCRIDISEDEFMKLIKDENNE